MVEVTEIIETESKEQVVKESEQRFQDAIEIENFAKQATRPSVRIQLESLAQKIQRDGRALERLEASRSKMQKSDDEEKAKANVEAVEEEVVVVEDVTGQEPATAAVASTPAVAAEESASSVAAAAKSTNTIATPMHAATLRYKSIDKFAFDAGGYNSPTVTIYISLNNVGCITKDNITCEFTSKSFDLKINDLEGVNYRLVKDNLDKDIDADKSKFIIKAHKIVIKLRKVKTEYGSYDSWTDLTSKKTKGATTNKTKSDPSSSIMELMKDMYDSGDDNMKKMIGETMLKQREGKLSDGSGDDTGLGSSDFS